MNYIINKIDRIETIVHKLKIKINPLIKNKVQFDIISISKIV